MTTAQPAKGRVAIPLPLRIIPVLYPVAERLIPFVARPFARWLFFSPFRFSPTAKELKAQSLATTDIIVAAGKKIKVFRWGKGPAAVLFTHGWAGRGTQFLRFIKPLLQRNFSVIAFDGPAHGQSGGSSTHLLEFSEVIYTLQQNYGPFEAMVGHSYGGVANLFAKVEHRLPIRKMVFIASPTIANEIISDFLKRINGSAKTGQYLLRWIETEFGQPFEEASIVNQLKQLEKDVRILLVYDENDNEVGLKHAHTFIQVWPDAELCQTSGLGHYRILKDKRVIDKCVDFICHAVF